MATQVQTRRGTTAQHSTFTGAAGELTVDTDKKTVVVHDGTTAGGAPLLRENGSQNAVTTGTSTAASFIPTSSTVPTNGIYLPTANTVALATNSASRLQVDSSGNVNIDSGTLYVDATNNWVGVGTTSPLRQLHVASAGTTYIRVEDSTNSVRTEVVSDITGGIIGTQTSHSLALQTGNIERARIDTSGRLLVGTSTARATDGASQAALQVETTGATTLQSSISVIRNNTDAFGGGIYFGKSKGSTLNSSTAVVNNDRLGFVAAVGADGTDINNQAASIYFECDGTVATGQVPGRITFNTTAVGAGSPTERMRIDSAGNIKFGSVGYFREVAGSPQIIEFGSFPGTSYSVERQIEFYTNSAGAGSAARMTIDGAGNVGIGRAPTYELDVYKASGAAIVACDSDSLANGEASAFIAFGGARQSEIGVYKHAGITNPCSYIVLRAEDNATSHFWVDNSDQLRISTSATHIGTTSGTVVGTQTSDERLKNILGPVEYGLDTLKQIEPVRYALKTEPDTEKLGFIAQQVLPFIPQSVFDTGEVIEEGEPTKLGMEYVALIPVLVNAIKELSAEVDALKAQLQ